VSVALGVAGNYNTVVQGVTVDTTKSQAIQLTLTCASAGAANANTLTLRQLHVQEMN